MSKIWVTIFILGLWTDDSFGQESPCDSVFTFVDQMPIYGNGTEDMMRYLTKTLKLNKSCRPDEPRYLIWTVTMEGKVVDIDLIGLEGKCKDQFIGQLKPFPTWTPGRLNGKLVCVKMVIPIRFRWQ